MKRFALALIVALAAPAIAGPNSGKTMTLTVPAGKHLAFMSPDPMAHPFVAVCKGGVKMRETKREVQSDGSTVWTFTCR
jgi:hypothetical protein